MDVDEDPLSDSSGNNNTAALKGDGEPNYTASGKFGGAYIWDGNNDYTTISDYSSIDVSLAYTILAAFKADNTSGDHCIISITQDTNDRNTIKLADDYAVANNYNGSFYGGTVSFTDTTAWHHIALVNASAGNATGYLDGVEITGTVWSGTSGTAHGEIGRGEDDTRTFDGSIDEAALFSRALDSTEINAIMDNGLAGTVVTRRIIMISQAK